MPRANRFFLPGHIWHITHRCHKQEFLLKFARDRRRWQHWLFEAKKRYGLCVLNYIVTSNHIHLLVLDRGRGEIACSMQLIAGRTAQEYNHRKARRGAYWEDRYHATAVDTEGYLARCMVYIDLNMVRAGAVSHPGKWPTSGYCEIQSPPLRYRIIDLRRLATLLNARDIEHLQEIHREWVELAAVSPDRSRDKQWSESIAVGHQGYVAAVKSLLGGKAASRRVVEAGHAHVLRESAMIYDTKNASKMAVLSDENTESWEENVT